MGLRNLRSALCSRRCYCLLSRGPHRSQEQLRQRHLLCVSVIRSRGSGLYPPLAQPAYVSDRMLAKTSIWNLEALDFRGTRVNWQYPGTAGLQPHVSPKNACAGCRDRRPVSRDRPLTVSVSVVTGTFQIVACCHWHP
eukprot:1468944-Rhodomonas_salina.2